MKIQNSVIKRLGYTLVAVFLLVAVSYPAFKPVKVRAAQLGSRSITLSDSGPSGGTITSGVGSGANVTYRFSFTTSASADSLVVDFCDGTASTPIINDACTAPTGMNAGSATVVGSGAGDTGNINGWTITPAASQIKLAKGGGSTAAAGSQVFSVTGITNQSTIGTFYARVYTYTNGTFGTYASATSVGNFVDYGGFALSTNRIISITARVQESLTFCVSGANQNTWTTNHDCSDPSAATAPSLTLGHGSPTPILDSNNVDYGTVFSQLSTNATYGATIAMRNSNSTCSNDGGTTFPSGLSADGGTTCAIPGAGDTAVAIVAGVAKFGMFVWDSQQDLGGVGTITPAATYHDNAHDDFTVGGVASSNFNDSGAIVPTDVFYGMDYTTAQTTQFGNVRTTFGSVVATCSGPVYRANSAYTFAATASLTTPAGVYSANLDLIATGTF
jgi:hypothetical protein